MSGRLQDAAQALAQAWAQAADDAATGAGTRDRPILQGIRVIELAGRHRRSGRRTAIVRSRRRRDPDRASRRRTRQRRPCCSRCSTAASGACGARPRQPSPAGRASLAQTPGDADVLLHDLGPAQALAQGLDDVALEPQLSAPYRLRHRRMAGQASAGRTRRRARPWCWRISACSTSSPAIATALSSCACPSPAGWRPGSAPSGSWRA